MYFSAFSNLFSFVLKQIHWCVKTMTIELDSSEVISLKAEASGFPPRCHLCIPLRSQQEWCGVVSWIYSDTPKLVGWQHFG